LQLLRRSNRTKSMQATTQAPAAPVTVTVTTADGKTQVLEAPRTREAMQQLVARRSQLTEELDDVTDRRNDLVEQLRTVPNAAEPGITAQLKVLNDRVVQLETDLAATGRQLSSASPDLVPIAEESSGEDVNGSFDDGVGAGVAGSVVVMSALLFYMWRRWRPRGAGRSARLRDDTSPRLARLEQGMDAIAIEIERISEGQRFVTKLLSESHGAATPPQRIGEPTTVAARDQTR
jgi:hypothetical protein